MAVKSGSLFLEIVNDIIYLVRFENEDCRTARIEYINTKVEDLTGYEPEAFLGDPSLWVKIIHPEDVGRVFRSVVRMIRRKKEVVREYRVKTKRGSYIWVEDKLIPVIEGGRTLGFVGIARDVTRRKVLEDISLLALEKDPQELFDISVYWIKEVLNADLVAVYEVPRGSQEGILRAGVGIRKDLIGKLRIPLREGTVLYYTYTSERPVTVPDINAEGRFRFLPYVYQMGFKSAVCTPIRGDREPFGAICVYSKIRREFSKRDTDFLHSLANILGLAIKRYRYERDLEESEQKLQKISRLYKTLSVINEIILQERDMDALLHKVCTTCTFHGGFKASWIALRGDSRLKIASFCGNVEDLLRKMEKRRLLEDPEKGGPWAVAFVRGEVVVSNDTEGVTMAPSLKRELIRRGYLSSISVPLRRKGNVFGVFTLLAGERNAFDEDTQQLVVKIADQVVFAFEFIEKEEELRKLSLAVEQTSDWVLIAGTDGRIHYVNKTVERLTGYRREELIGQTPKIFKSGKHTRAFYRRLWNALSEGRMFRGVFINRRKDGKLFYLDQTITPLKDREGKVIGYVATGKDITEQRELQEKLNYFAYYDPVTELPNRTNFMERLRLSISRTKLLNRFLAVLLIDMDRFKYVNDTYGYLTGDSVLKEVGNRIKSALREGDTVARLGSDEFGVILIDLARKEDISKVLAKIFARMEEPFRVNGEEIRLTISVGVSVFPEDGSEAEDLVKKAEIALAHAKEEFSNSYQFFREEMNTRMAEFVLMEKHLLKALERREYKIFYQPYYELKDLSLYGMEALLRWESPDLGFVPPSRFIPILENTGLILEVGEWVLREVCTRISRWQVPVSVNISPVQFKDRSFPDRIERVIERCGVEGRFIVLEITENTIMEDVEFAKRSLDRLKEMGVRVAVDDFGTGYSSLAYLKILPVDYLKIDVSFVRDIDRDPDDRAIVNAIIQLARNLGLKTIAEGIESGEQLEILREMGCDVGQGFYLARPMPEEKLLQLLKL